MYLLSQNTAKMSIVSVSYCKFKLIGKNKRGKEKEASEVRIVHTISCSHKQAIDFRSAGKNFYVMLHVAGLDPSLLSSPSP